MRKLFAVLLLALGSLSNGQAQQSYHIEGRIAGESDGYKVYLIEQKFGKEEVKLDSAVISDGKFYFEGTVDRPDFHRIVIDRTPKGQGSNPRNFLSNTFYLENSTITYSGHIDSLSTYFYTAGRIPAEIVGSATQDEYNRYRQSIKRYTERLGDLDRTYNEVYHMPSLKGEFNIAEGIELAKQMNELNEKGRQAKIDYIKENASSIIAYNEAQLFFYMLDMELTVEQIDELISAVKSGWGGTPEMEEFMQLAEQGKKTALGATYMDFELTKPDGTKARISDFVKPGQYTLLEFWASWCGPCRGEIPHLRQVYHDWKDKGFELVSISIDENDKHWKKAMEEEGMVWTQLNDPNGFEGDMCQSYGIMGIPYAIMVDDTGKIVRFGMRGAFLDAALDELINQK